MARRRRNSSTYCSHYNVLATALVAAWMLSPLKQLADVLVDGFHREPPSWNHQRRFGWGNGMFPQHRDCALALPAITFRRTATVLFMGKGDGKKKRKKKEEPSVDVPSSSSASSQPPPLRVLSNVNIPVRQQIALANMNKMVRQQQQPSSRSGTGFAPRVRTAYRRTWAEEEVERKAEERQRRGQEPNWDVILNRTAVDPLLIVDGYNIIYAWPRLKKHMLKGDPARARQLLMDDLENLQSIKGWRIECVFDGTRRASIGPLGSTNRGTSAAAGLNPLTRGVDQATKMSVSKYGVRIVYSGVGTEADTYIESRCVRAKNVTHGEITGSLIVATDDAMIRLAGQSAGAVCMSASRFVEELKAIHNVISYRVEAAVALVNGQAIRPAPLRGAPPTRFGRRSVVMEDKRNRTKVSKKEDATYAVDVSTMPLEEDENGIPWWAKAPEPSKVLKG
jgi:uncharacterized protein